MTKQSNKSTPLATAANAAAPGLLQQVGMAGTAAVITVTFIHPIGKSVGGFFHHFSTFP